MINHLKLKVFFNLTVFGAISHLKILSFILSFIIKSDCISTTFLQKNVSQFLNKMLEMFSFKKLNCLKLLIK